MPLPIRFQLKTFYRNGTVKVATKKNKRRLSSFIQANYNLEIEKYFIKVTYSPIIDNFNKKISPTNEGFYYKKQDLYQAIGAFTEK